MCLIPPVASSRSDRSGTTNPMSEARSTIESMGVLVYGSDSQAFEIDDRALSHLKVIILGRFRRHEAFTLSWNNARDAGGGREFLWMNPALPLRFQIHTNPGPINPEWLKVLSDGVNGSDVCLVAEP